MRGHGLFSIRLTTFVSVLLSFTIAAYAGDKTDKIKAIGAAHNATLGISAAAEAVAALSKPLTATKPASSKARGQGGQRRHDGGDRACCTERASASGRQEFGP